MKILTLTFLLAFASFHCLSQSRQEIDSLTFPPLIWSNGLDEKSHAIENLTNRLAIAKEDTSRVLIMADFCNLYGYSNPDSSIIYGKKALLVAQQIKYLRGEARALHALAVIYRILGEDPKSLELLYKGLQIAEDNQYPVELERCLNSIGLIYLVFEDYPRAISFFQRSNRIDATIQNKPLERTLLGNIAYTYEINNQLDSALSYAGKSFHALKLSGPNDDAILDPILSCEFLFMIIGDLQFKLGNHQIAFEYLQKCIQINQKNNFHRAGYNAYFAIANCFKKLHQTDSCIFYAKKGLIEAQRMSSIGGISSNSTLLADQYESTDAKEALYYLKIAKSANDGLYNARKAMSLEKTFSDEQERQRRIETQKIAYQNKIKQYTLLAGLGVFLLIAFILYRNNRQKQKANKLLFRQKEEINLQRDNAEKALASLKATQTQLIQSEKMASLGELTAGIAHEIQNPLNFVNNFSEINKDLLIEMKNEMDDGNTNAARGIANDIIENEQKINHHGKRADAIVKGMLQHAQSGTGRKEQTDINALADEYLRLSYQGLRAREKTFSATLRTDFDNSIGKMNIVPQEIGRVLLNLYNNAFYAVAEKKKKQAGGYEPAVLVSTKKMDGKVEIKVKDNGMGIPQKALDKIFQPFFTTKPAGQGTGLGLSLCYDIIKAHEGEIRVETKEGEYTEFVILLPA